MSDLISRQAAIDAVRAFYEEYVVYDNGRSIEEILSELPSAQPERKKGQWFSDVAYYDEDGCPCIVSRCSECGEAYPVSNFCPNCGADMRGEANADG